MNKRNLVVELLATCAVVGDMVGGPYSMQGFKLQKHSNRPAGYHVCCCECGAANTTLRKLDGDKRICQKCFDKYSYKKER